MPYDQTIQTEAQYVDNLGSTATEDMLYATYNGILAHWFPASRGYLIDQQVIGEGGKPECFVVLRHDGGYRNPLLIVELKRPSKWTAAAKDEVQNDLQTYIERQFGLTKYNSIYGVGAIGLRWMVCKMEKSGAQLAPVLDWQNNIASDTSYTQFQTIADLVYNIT